MLVLSLVARCKNCGTVIRCKGREEDQKVLLETGEWPEGRMPRGLERKEPHRCDDSGVGVHGLVEFVGFRVADTAG
jgi:hypothetical protein